MMAPPASEDPRVSSSRSRGLPIDVGDESFVEDYGEPSTSARTVSGGVDFFSSLGTERKKPPRPDQPDPDKVSLHKSISMARTT